MTYNSLKINLEKIEKTMSRYSIKVICFILLFGCTQSKINKGNQSNSKNSFEKYMDAHADINGFSGTVLVTRDDSILLKKAYGIANYEWDIKNTIDSKFSLASISKQFTAVAILQLAEKNKLSVDDKLIKFFPGYPNAKDMTVKMLLTHNSGISEEGELHNSNSAVSQDSIVDYTLSNPLLYEPGSETRYSNNAYNILSILIEKVSGQSYADYLQEHIFNPAGMTNSGVSSNDSIVKKLAKPYYYGQPKQDKLIQNPFINWHYCLGLDGVYSTIEDMYLWNKHLIDKNTLLSEDSKKQMFTSYNDNNFGYGVMVNPWYSHNRNFIGHDGGYYGTVTSFQRYLDENICIVVLSNNQSPSHLLAYGLSAMALGLPVEFPYRHKKIEIDPNLFSDYVGNYEGVRIHEANNILYYSDNNYELVPESETKFFRAIDNDRTVEFIKNENGKVFEMVTVTAGVKQHRHKNKSD